MESSRIFLKRPVENVLICWNCCDKVPQTGGFNNRNDFLIIMPRSPRSGVSGVVSLESSLWQQTLFVPGVLACSPFSQCIDTTQIGGDLL